MTDNEARIREAVEADFLRDLLTEEWKKWAIEKWAGGPKPTEQKEPGQQPPSETSAAKPRHPQDE